MVGDGNARLVFLGEDHRLLNLMRQPLPPKRRFRLRARPPKLRTVWAWTRRIEITAGTHEAIGEDLIEALGAILASDWADPTGWTVPEGSKLSVRSAV